MQIDRSALVERLRAFALENHGVITGSPGVGKTVAVSQLTSTLLDEGRATLLLDVTDLGDATDESVRSVLPHSGELVESLGRYFTGRGAPGVVIIDGFDAARDPVVRQRVLRLVRRLVLGAHNRWRVLVTVRTYDAAKSPDLLALFPPERGGGGTARHVEVPMLERDELERVLDQVPGLREVYSQATTGLRELLRLPFHLWLIEQVLRAPASSSGEDAVRALSQVNTEVQLLDRYWRSRITAAPHGGALATLTKAAAQVMVTDQALAVPVPEVWRPEMQSAWDELLSNEVFSLGGPAVSRVAFSHNILFDYAVSLYVLSENAADMEGFLVEQPSRALFLRPSLVYIFAHLWEEGRPAFWRLFQTLAGRHELPVRLVARLIPPYVLASESRAIDDLVPLRRMDWHDRDQVLLWTLQAVRFSAAPRLDLWADFVSELAIDASPAYAWEAAGLLNVLLARANVPSEQDELGSTLKASVRSSVGVAARRLLQRALLERARVEEVRARWWDSFGANQALPLVLDTFETDPIASSAAIRPVLQLIREREVPIRYFTALARGIKSVIRYDPALAADVYRSTFSHVELSEAPTAMGGAVLRLQSTRRQDFEMAYYGLVKAFPEFLEVDPREAVRAGLESGGVDVLRDRVFRHIEPSNLEAQWKDRMRSLRFRGIEVWWIEDHSGIWGSRAREDGAQLIRRAAEHVAKLAASRDERLPEVLDDYAAHAHISFAWARLLRAGAATPALAAPLRELATQRSVQVSLDLRESLGKFLHAAAPHWEHQDRIDVERSILSLAGDESTGLRVDRRERLRDQLLAALPFESLATPEARHRLEELRAANNLPTIEPPVQFHAQAVPYTHEDWLQEQGVDPERHENAVLRAQLEPLETFQSTWRNENPPDEAIAEIEPVVLRALDAVEAARDADTLVRQEAWTALAGTVATIARSPSAMEDLERWERVRIILLRAWAEPSGDVGDDADAEFTWPHWSPSPHTEAVQGLGSMLWKRADPEVISKVEEILSTARDPSLRFLAMRYVLGVHRYDPDRYWEIVRGVAGRERNVVVVTELLNSAGRLVWKTPQLVRELAEVLWSRWRTSDHKDLWKSFAPVLILLVAHGRDDWAELVLQEILQDPLSNEVLLNQILFEASAALTPDNAQEPRQPHIPHLVEILVNGVKALSRADYDLRQRQEQGEALADERGRVHQMVETVASRVDLNLRYDAGVRKRTNAGNAADARDLRSPQVVAYYRLVWPIIEEILDFGGRSETLIAQTAHHLIELFNVILKADPATVLQAANRAVQAGRGDNYNLDSMAIREVVQLMETVLADHRDVLLAGEPMEAALQLLDTFAEAGWTEALHLIWRLDEVFR